MQTIAHSRLGGRVVRYYGNAKDDVSEETTQDWQLVTVAA